MGTTDDRLAEIVKWFAPFKDRQGASSLQVLKADYGWLIAEVERLRMYSLGLESNCDSQAATIKRLAKDDERLRAENERLELELS